MIPESFHSRLGGWKVFQSYSVVYPDNKKANIPFLRRSRPHEQREIDNVKYWHR